MPTTRHNSNARAETNVAASRSTLRDKSMAYEVRYLFGNRFEVEGNGHRYYVEGVWFQGDVLASCKCPDKAYNCAETCKHEMSVIRFERSRVAASQFN
jgi:hypothetical protein